MIKVNREHVQNVSIKIAKSIWKRLDKYAPAILYSLTERPLPLNVLIDLWILSLEKPYSKLVRKDVSNYGIVSIDYQESFDIAFPRDCFLYRLKMATENYIMDRSSVEYAKLWHWAEDNGSLYESMVRLIYKLHPYSSCCLFE